METGKSTFLQKNKKPVLIGAIAVILLGITAIFVFKKHKSLDNQQLYAKYIDSYTSGTISKKSFIRIQLASQVKTMGEIGKPDERNLFSFSPAVKGKTYWIDAQTIEFRPDDKLESGKTYQATFDLSKVAETEKGLEEFEFDFKVIHPGLVLSQDGLISQNNTSLTYMKLTGEISTADEEDPKKIEKCLELNFNQPLKIKCSTILRKTVQFS